MNEHKRKHDSQWASEWVTAKNTNSANEMPCQNNKKRLWKLTRAIRFYVQMKNNNPMVLYVFFRLRCFSHFFPLYFMIFMPSDHIFVRLYEVVFCSMTICRMACIMCNNNAELHIYVLDGEINNKIWKELILKFVLKISFDAMEMAIRVKKFIV